MLIKDAVLPLKPNTRLRWSWRVDQLPSKTREDNLFTHDYLSIAVEFDHGQDLTYYCSCRSTPASACGGALGLEGLGQWFDEERDVYRDYGEKIGGAFPAKIIRRLADRREPVPTHRGKMPICGHFLRDG